jgi:hypothetical protein
MAITSFFRSLAYTINERTSIWVSISGVQFIVNRDCPVTT